LLDEYRRHWARRRIGKSRRLGPVAQGLHEYQQLAELLRRHCSARADLQLIAVAITPPDQCVQLSVTPAPFFRSRLFGGRRQRNDLNWRCIPELTGANVFRPRNSALRASVITNGITHNSSSHPGNRARPRQGLLASQTTASSVQLTTPDENWFASLVMLNTTALRRVPALPTWTVPPLPD
jgi:hypothetical protein